MKKVISLVLTFLFVISFAGCGEVKSNTPLYIYYSVSGELTEADVSAVTDEINVKFPDEEIGVVDIYAPVANMYMTSIDEDAKEIIHVFGIDPGCAMYLGLEELEDGTAYFETNPLVRPHLETDVITEVTEHGVTCADMAETDLNTAHGVDKNLPLVSSFKENYFTPGMLGEKYCFVSTNTFNEIVKLSCSPELDESVYESFRPYNIAGIFICGNNSEEVKNFVAELGYYVK